MKNIIELKTVSHGHFYRPDAYDDIRATNVHQLAKAR